MASHPVLHSAYRGRIKKVRCFVLHASATKAEVYSEARGGNDAQRWQDNLQHNLIDSVSHALIICSSDSLADAKGGPDVIVRAVDALWYCKTHANVEEVCGAIERGMLRRSSRRLAGPQTPARPHAKNT